MIVLLMAAGLSKRFMKNSDTPKVIYPINGIPMIIHIINQVLELNNVEKIFIIVNNIYYSKIKECVDNFIDNNIIEYIFQDEPNGTGGAIKSTLEYIKKYNNNALIISGDTPYIKKETIQELFNKTNSMLITKLDDPKHNGRIIIKNNSITEIVEFKDCNEEEKNIKYVNCGIYNFEILNLLKFIPLLNNQNKANEYYLTDIIKMMNNDNIIINYYDLEKDKQIEIYNINTMEDLHKSLDILML